MISRRNKIVWPLILLLLLGLWGGAGIRVFGVSSAPVAEPFWRLGAGARNLVGLWGNFFRTRSALWRDHQLLVQELDQATAKLLAYDSVVADNLWLRSQLGVQATADHRLISARAISHPGLTPYDIFFVDVGWENSMVADLPTAPPVLFGDSVILGVLTEVGDLVSRVSLLSAVGRETPVWIGTARLPAVAVGRGGGNLLVTLPRGLDVAVGEVVTTSAAGQEFGLGEVGGVNQNPADPLQEIFIRQPVNLNQLGWVNIYVP